MWGAKMGSHVFSSLFPTFEPSVSQAALFPTISQTQSSFQPGQFPDASYTCHDLPPSAFLQDRLSLRMPCPSTALTESACPSMHLIVSMSYT